MLIETRRPDLVVISGHMVSREFLKRKTTEKTSAPGAKRLNRKEQEFRNAASDLTTSAFPFSQDFATIYPCILDDVEVQCITPKPTKPTDCWIGRSWSAHRLAAATLGLPPTPFTSAWPDAEGVPQAPAKGLSSKALRAFVPGEIVPEKVACQWFGVTLNIHLIF